MEQEWSNWSGSVTCQPRQLLSPASEEEVAAIVRRGRGRGQTRARDRHRPFLHAAVRQRRRAAVARSTAGIESVDAAHATGWIRAGTKIHDLGGAAGRAWAGAGEPGGRRRAGHRRRRLDRHARHRADAGEHFDASRRPADRHGRGRRPRCSPERDAEVFRAAQVSLGSLGVITAVRLQLLPLYRLHEVPPRAARRVPDSLDERSRANRHFEFFWYPADDCAFTKTLNPTERPATVDTASQES